MADVTDIANALAGMAAAAVYPNGTGAPSVAGVGVKVFPGWPSRKQLDDDLKAGRVNVSVFPMPTERNVTRYDRDMRTFATRQRTLALTLSGDGRTVTIGGTVTTPHIVGLVVDGKSYVYAVQTGDTLASIATALATLISPDVAVSSAGPAITFDRVRAIAPALAVTGTLYRELRRGEKQIMLTVWAPSPAARSAVGKPIANLMAEADWLQLPDTIPARIRVARIADDDREQEARIYRRDIVLEIEWAMVELIDATEVAVVELKRVGGGMGDEAEAPVVLSDGFA